MKVRELVAVLNTLPPEMEVRYDYDQGYSTCPIDKVWRDLGHILLSDEWLDAEGDRTLIHHQPEQ